MRRVGLLAVVVGRWGAGTAGYPSGLYQGLGRRRVGNSSCEYGGVLRWVMRRLLACQWLKGLPGAQPQRLSVSDTAFGVDDGTPRATLVPH